MDQCVDIEVAECDSCAGGVTTDGCMGIGEDHMSVGEDSMQHVILEVDAREGFAVLAFDGEVLLMLGVWTVVELLGEGDGVGG